MDPHERRKAKEEIRRRAAKSGVLQEIFTAIDLNDLTDEALADTLEALRNPLTKRAREEIGRKEDGRF